MLSWKRFGAALDELELLFCLLDYTGKHFIPVPERSGPVIWSVLRPYSAQFSMPLHCKCHLNSIDSVTTLTGVVNALSVAEPTVNVRQQHPSASALGNNDRRCLLHVIVHVRSIICFERLDIPSPYHVLLMHWRMFILDAQSFSLSLCRILRIRCEESTTASNYQFLIIYVVPYISLTLSFAQILSQQCLLRCCHLLRSFPMFEPIRIEILVLTWFPIVRHVYLYTISVKGWLILMSLCLCLPSSSINLFYFNLHHRLFDNIYSDAVTYSDHFRCLSLSEFKS
jgi:hypothetical protein